jgi:hypothetical protein
MRAGRELKCKKWLLGSGDAAAQGVADVAGLEGLVHQ